MEPRDLEEIARRHGIELIVEFGSMVTGHVHPKSDVDLAILFHERAPSFRELAAVGHELQAAYPHREVDVAVVNHADPLFLKKITEACRLLYGSPRDFQRLKIYAFKRYQDHRKYLDMERSYVERSLQALAAK